MLILLLMDDFKLERYRWLLEFELYYFLLFSLQISRKLSMWWKVLFQCFQALISALSQEGFDELEAALNR